MGIGDEILFALPQVNLHLLIHRSTRLCPSVHSWLSLTNVITSLAFKGRSQSD